MTNAAGIDAPAPFIVQTALGAVLIVAGLAVAVIGALGLLGRLPRNRFAGVRTEASMRDDDTFRAANRVAGLPFLAAGVVAAGAGGIAIATQDALATVIIMVIGVVGLFGMMMAGGALGNQAAAAVPKKPAGGCGGCCGGGCAKALLGG
ncbi:SdpI family protein [Allokutzneria albata]|uniref:SdpI/YhfL protein family protein n=1 Tax=Allokutzneria albata TaxID=211114 RepID=A0A1G9ZY72_ALLAB|nr:SdpI family protein [Allokutzneria albata]SDN25486.1 SdpI/YhfL protein family protein [Allokutzneria albata]